MIFISKKAKQKVASRYSMTSAHLQHLQFLDEQTKQRCAQEIKLEFPQERAPTLDRKFTDEARVFPYFLVLAGSNGGIFKVLLAQNIDSKHYGCSHYGNFIEEGVPGTRILTL